MIRQPVVAGLFYPASAVELKRQLATFVSEEDQQQAAAVVLPHAGYGYSGDVAGDVISRIRVPHQVILLGPNHHGSGKQMAVSAVDAWATPLGDVAVAAALRSHLLDEVPQLELDDSAHQQEHSLEVLLPFLQYVQSQLQVVPIAITHSSPAQLIELGAGIARAINNWNEPVLLIASSDMNHFLPAAENVRLDSLAIDAMTAFDPQRLYRIVADQQISMCGMFAVVAVMEAAKLLGAHSCELIRYSHSGEKSGDNSRVVGYAGMIMN
ncbi:AmmeMemoRadiSam system protein B [Pelovirga terrestris]|uniref:MEMO1 family protein ICT70_00485 n=1 Tax=Pelovirga terrestris TaxID=2771352 RepID=A0A8J6QLA0_9BACT|nr:AmmeMemoRadiSam system protein B [Pelovirga terrestris]MBD1399142.1 AmmeMemoRadiSam system protein B [Pelovirga terrestris]